MHPAIRERKSRRVNSSGDADFDGGADALFDAIFYRGLSKRAADMSWPMPLSQRRGTAAK